MKNILPTGKQRLLKVPERVQLVYYLEPLIFLCCYQLKFKFLFEVATIYGFDTSKYDERLFLLYVFQSAFSSEEKRRETLFIIENWEEQKEKLVDMDWRVFQQEYRDHIDLIKMFQLIPGFGAIVGAYANHNLMDRLAETALNVYRMRILEQYPRNY